MSRELIELDAEEAHELLFKIQVEGIDVAPARVRLVCESQDFSYMFNGKSSGEHGVVQFDIPTMKGRLSEGPHLARVEVLIDNKYFAPIQFDVKFKETKVFAEVVSREKQTQTIKKQEPTVTVEAITVKKQTPEQSLPIQTPIRLVEPESVEKKVSEDKPTQTKEEPELHVTPQEVIAIVTSNDVSAKEEHRRNKSALREKWAAKRGGG